MRRLGTPVWSLLIPGLLHLHLHITLHHHIHGPPFDYVGLAAACAASWVGVPGPGEPVLLAAGILAAKHHLDLVSVVAVAWLAATAGGIAGWAIGLKAGRAVFTARGPLRSLRIRTVERGEEIFRRYPVIAVLMTPSWIAGVHRVRPVVYMPVNAISAAVWAAGIGVGGYLVGPLVLDVFADLGTGLSIVVGAVVVATVGLELTRRHRHPSE